LARCFLKVPDCSLVLLDEPSSALDAKAEHDLFEKIVCFASDGSRLLIFGQESLAKDAEGKRWRTLIFITHRFNTVRRADKIAVFKEVRCLRCCRRLAQCSLTGNHRRVRHAPAAHGAQGNLCGPVFDPGAGLRGLNLHYSCSSFDDLCCRLCASFHGASVHESTVEDCHLFDASLCAVTRLCLACHCTLVPACWLWLWLLTAGAKAL
jgi:hypothetical protein